jgi:hypothetical protein
MNVSRILKVAILSVFAPVILVSSTAAGVLASDPTGGEGNIFHEGRGGFSNGKWYIGVECGEDPVYLHYKNDKPIVLRGSDLVVANRNGKKIYTWSQKGARYRLSWNPLDPKFAKLEIFDTSGKKAVNTLLKVDPLPPC